MSWSAAGPKHVVSYMKDFLFAQEQMRTPAGGAVRRRSAAG